MPPGRASLSVDLDTNEEDAMSPKRLAIVALVVASVAVGVGALATHANGAAARHIYGFHGSVTRTDRSRHWLRIHTAGNGVMRFQTRHAIHWDGCNWGEMHHGHAVSIHAYKSHGHWMATRISDWQHHDTHGGMHDGMHGG
jgi:hypothetical protein